jgi:hypothetical protein
LEYATSVWNHQYAGQYQSTHASGICYSSSLLGGLQEPRKP